jgi:hypothetical protein
MQKTTPENHQVPDNSLELEQEHYMPDSHGASPIKQQLQVVEVDPRNIELRVTTSDDAASLLWAAQWLDEHREYSMTGIRLNENNSYSDDDGDTTATLIIKLHLFHERTPGKLGPWPHGVPQILPDST